MKQNFFKTAMIAGLSLGPLSGTALANASDLCFNYANAESPHSVFLASELDEWAPDQMAMPEIAAGRYQLCLPSPWMTSVQYKFVVDGIWLTDSANAQTASDGHGGLNSVIPTQFVEDPLLNLQPGVSPWNRSTFEVQDSSGAARQIIVMSPNVTGKRALKKSVTVYFNDGSSYLNEGNAAQIIANLSAQTDMPLITGVFLDPRDRMTEYEDSDDYTHFVASVVVPEVEKRFSVERNPKDRLIVGASLGGLISTYIGLKRSDVFGNAASESGSFWYGNQSILSVIENASPSQTKLYFDVGTYEEPLMLNCNHAARDQALKSGFNLQYQEFPSLHNFTGWRNRLVPILRHFFAS